MNRSTIAACISNKRAVGDEYVNFTACCINERLHHLDAAAASPIHGIAVERATLADASQMQRSSARISETRVVGEHAVPCARNLETFLTAFTAVVGSVERAAGTSNA